MRFKQSRIRTSLMVAFVMATISVAGCGGGDEAQVAPTSSDVAVRDTATPEAATPEAATPVAATPVVIEGPAFSVGDAGGAVGSQVVVAIKAVEVESLAGFKMTVTLDPKVATLAEVEQGDFVAAFLFVDNIDEAAGTVSIAAIADKAVSGSGEVAKLKIELRSKSDTSITLVIEEAVDEMGSSINIKPYPGTLSLS